MPNPQTLAVRGEYITLGQLLKVLDLVQSGAETKLLLADGGFFVNDVEDNRRGRKLRPGDVVRLPNGMHITMTEPK